MNDTTPTATPAAEVDIDDVLVRRLLEAQHPDLAELPLAAVDAGWDNAMFRLGKNLAVRLPRRAVSAELVAHEQQWLGVLAPRLPAAVPAPLRIGGAGSGFPWSWSVVPWLPGEPADVEPLQASQGRPLARFLAALHQPAPDEAPVNPVRGVPLAERRDVVAARLERLATATPHITEVVHSAWRAALAAPADFEMCWIHGDLHPRNVLAANGELTAVIDWGDICRGDPATDLAAVWTLLNDIGARREAIAAYGRVPPGTWLRALGWAVSFGTVLLETGLADHPRHAQIGRDVLRRIDEGPNAAHLA